MEHTTIGICDDEPEICEITKKMIADLLSKLYGDEDEFFEIKVFHTAKALLDEIDSISIVAA